ncbi:MAG: ATP synthase F1 subunit delta [Pseudobdellovibrionaceae bacterium]
MSAIRNYAKALFIEAKQGHRESEVMEQLSQVAKGFTEVEGYREFFLSPMVPIDQKYQILNSIKTAKALPELFEILSIMMTNNRMSQVPELLEEYRQFFDESTGVLRGKVISATVLSDKSKSEIVDKMSHVLKKKVIFDYLQDEAILGGTKIEVAGLTFDDSLQSHLNRMSENLNRSSI